MDVSAILDKKWYGGLYHLHNTQDTWEQWISEFEVNYEYSEDIKDKLIKIFSNNVEHIEGKYVIDLACNLGYFALAASNLGAYKTIGLEIRESYIETFNKVIKYWSKKDVSLIKSNIENLQELEKYLDGIDTIIYSGHFYHTNQNEDILKCFTLSSAQCIILESTITKVRTDEYQIYKESTLDPLNGYIDEFTDTITVKVLTPEKTKLLLEDLGWNIIRYDTLDLFNPRRFIITAVRKN